MYLTKTLNAVRTFEASIQAAKEEFVKAQREITETYKDHAATAKLAEARNLRTEIEMRETTAALEAVKADFAAAREAVAETVTRPAPEGFDLTLQALQTKGERIGKTEMAAYLQKFKGNYLAFSTLLEVLHANNLASDIHFLSADRLNNEMETLENRILYWIKNRHGVTGDAEYYARILTHEKHSPAIPLGEKIEAFVNGDYILMD